MNVRGFEEAMRQLSARGNPVAGYAATVLQLVEGEGAKARLIHEFLHHCEELGQELERLVRQDLKDQGPAQVIPLMARHHPSR